MGKAKKKFLGLDRNALILPVFDDLSKREAWKVYRDTGVLPINPRISSFWLARLAEAFNAGIECAQAGVTERELVEWEIERRKLATKEKRAVRGKVGTPS